MHGVPASGSYQVGRQRPASRFAPLAALLALGLSAAAVHADETDVFTQRYAHRLAVGTCGICHGAQGNSTQPKFPRLAGQNANYLVTQLKAFRDQARGDPDAISYMWGMARELDDKTISALAAYYATQKPVPVRRRDLALIARGKEIYEHGIESAGVPACNACHGPDAHGLADFPRLASQHAQYVLKQLASFQSNMRDVAVMHGIAQSLRESDMQAVAAFLQAQP